MPDPSPPPLSLSLSIYFIGLGGELETLSPILTAIHVSYACVMRLLEPDLAPVISKIIITAATSVRFPLLPRAVPT